MTGTTNNDKNNITLSKSDLIFRYIIVFLFGVLCAAIAFTGYKLVKRSIAAREQAAIEESLAAEPEAVAPEVSGETAAPETSAATEAPAGPVAEIDEDHSVSVATTDQPAEKDDNGNMVKDEVPGNDIQIVTFADSIWDNFRDETGIAAQLDTLGDFQIYNCSFGASAASRMEEDSEETDKKVMTTLVDIATGHAGNVTPESYSHNAIDRVTFMRTNYFVLAYGLNDFFNGSPIRNSYNKLDKTCYTGSIRYSIETIRATYPNARIVLVSPNYITNNPKNNYGTIDNYISAVQELATEYGTAYFNPNEAIGITTDNCDSFLVDGTHLNKDARAKYAAGLKDVILADWNH
ncbi:MAG: GDSL-type esterase/lipase family protein [Lachnospiraceae bacterium]|nr:GDSL-type esterase/lipase family protein [Lachnospiraceae bacterium]